MTEQQSRFTKGDRVTHSIYGLGCNIGGRNPFRYGVIEGFSRDGMPRIRWDGTHSAQTGCHPNFLSHALLEPLEDYAI